MNSMPHWSLNLDAVIWSPIPTLWTSKNIGETEFSGDWFCHNNGNFPQNIFYSHLSQETASIFFHRNTKAQRNPRKKLALRQPLPWSFLSAAASWNAAPPPRVARHSSNPSFSEDAPPRPCDGERRGPFLN